MLEHKNLVFLLKVSVSSSRLEGGCCGGVWYVLHVTTEVNVTEISEINGGFANYMTKNRFFAFLFVPRTTMLYCGNELQMAMF